MAKASKKVTMVEQPVEATPALTTTSIKGFKYDLTCRGHQFEVGQTYAVEGPIQACYSGWHACPEEHHPLSVFSFYPPVVDQKPARYCVVEQSGKMDAEGTKLASAKITIGVELRLGDLAKRAIKWVMDRAKPTAGDYAHSATAGNDAHSATTGDYAHSATAGNGANSATTGDYAHSATAGDYAHSATTGDYAHSATTGKNAIAASLGRNGQAKANSGAIVIAYYDDNGDLQHIAAARVGDAICGVTIEPGTWYRLTDNGSVEVVEG